jgi:hypothetical protein
MGMGFTRLPHPLEIFRAGQPKSTLHPILERVFTPRLRFAGLPTNLLDVLVRTDGQFYAALEAAAL